MQSITCQELAFEMTMTVDQIHVKFLLNDFPLQYLARLLYAHTYMLFCGKYAVDQ